MVGVASLVSLSISSRYCCIVATLGCGVIVVVLPSHALTLGKQIFPFASPKRVTALFVVLDVGVVFVALTNASIAGSFIGVVLDPFVVGVAPFVVDQLFVSLVVPFIVDQFVVLPKVPRTSAPPFPPSPFAILASVLFAVADLLLGSL